MGQHPGRAFTAGKDFDFKYKATDRFDQMECCLIGSCIAPSSLTGTGKARSAGNNNLRGIIADSGNVYTYFLHNGAKIVCMDFNVPATPSGEINDKVKQFLQRSGNNKLLYFTGHGDSDGDICLDGGYIQVHHVFQWLAEANFSGVLTIVVDACYSGKWAKRAYNYINGQRDYADTIYHRLADAAERAGKKTYINLRCSSLGNETSLDSNQGGRYTQELTWCLRREWRWTSQDGAGWGTKVLTERKPNEQDCFWTVSESEAQTDVVLDLVIKPDRSTFAYYPSSRAPYVK